MASYQFHLTNGAVFTGTWEAFNEAYPVAALVAADVSLSYTVALEPIVPLVVFA